MAMVSVIIPAHNPGEHLRQALASVHGQTFDGWDVVVVDDDSAEDLSWVPAEFPRARWVRQPHGGVSVARNNGVLSTAGEFVAFMDQDDLWRPEKLRRQVDAMRRDPTAGVCYCDLDVFTDGAEPPPVTVADPEAVVELDPAATEGADGAASPMLRSVRHFARRFVVPSTVMLRRSCLATSGLLDPFIPFSGDFDLLIKLGGRHRVVRVPSADVLYRKHASNFSGQYDVGRREVKALIARYVAYADATGDDALAREAPRLFGRPRRMYAAQAFDRARQELRHGRYKAMAYHWARAAMFSPTYSLASSVRWAMSRAAKGKGI